MLDRIFKLSQNGTCVKTEIIAGLTTFMTMAYIVALNPNLLTNFGAESTALWNGVFMATCIASAIGTFCMAFLANKPFAMAPGMGLNSFFAIVVGNLAAMTGMSYVASFQAALLIILIEGIVFLALSVMNVREKIVEAIPLGIRLGISPAIGMMLIDIGFGSNVGIYAEGNGFSAPFYVMRDFFGALTPAFLRDNMGSDGYATMVLTVITIFTGLLSICILAKKGVNGAVLFGMLIASAIYWAGSFLFIGSNPFAPLATASFMPPFEDMLSTTFFKFNIAGFLEMGWFTVITLVVTFCAIDMFDTIGTLVGAATSANMIDENGKMPNMKEALLSDAVGTITGACTGTSTVSTFIESAAGVSAGGRTGLTSVVTGLMFLVCIFLAPAVAVIPAAATSAALIYVGILMLQGLKEIDFGDMEQMVPAGLMLIGMPVSGSIGHAIGIGLISCTVMKLFSGKGREVSVLTYTISVMFLVKFFLIV